MDSFRKASRKIRYARILHQEPSLRVFTYAELEKATSNFNSSLVIGEGQYGKIYKGIIRDTEDRSEKIYVAVKDLSKGLQAKEDKEWVAEFNELGDIEHENLVKLLGYSASNSKTKELRHRFLVYEYMENRSIQDHLMNSFSKPLSWRTRLRIAQDAARGLAFLHENQIVMRCFKPSVVLLDGQYNAKLSDFIFAKLGPFPFPAVEVKEQYGWIYRDFAGHASPEFSMNGELTYVNDVWGYGVFLFELITGRRAWEPNRPSGEKVLVRWIEEHFTEMNKFELVLDPRLERSYSLESAHELAAIAKMCMAEEPQERPSMTKVLKMVSEIMEAS